MTTTVKSTGAAGHYEVFRGDVFIERVYATPYNVYAKKLSPDERTAVQLKAAADYKRSC